MARAIRMAAEAARKAAPGTSEGELVDFRWILLVFVMVSMLILFVFIDFNGFCY